MRVRVYTVCVCLCEHRWMRDVYSIADVHTTVDLADIRRSYFSSLFPLNPGCIVPRGPDIADIMNSSNTAQDTAATAISGGKSSGSIFHAA
jgi:glutathionyl-hydroquinone reductase